jgi:hypothetical protein
MTIEEAFRAYLGGVASVTALVGSGANARIYPQAMPQNPTFPAVIYMVVSNPVKESHSGNSALAHPRFRINCWSQDYIQAKTLAREIRRALQGFKGIMGGAGGVDVDGVDFEDGSGGGDLFDDELQIHGVQMDCVIWHDDP